MNVALILLPIRSSYFISKFSIENVAVKNLSPIRGKKSMSIDFEIKQLELHFDLKSVFFKWQKKMVMKSLNWHSEPYVIFSPVKMIIKKSEMFAHKFLWALLTAFWKMSAYGSTFYEVNINQCPHT